MTELADTYDQAPYPEQAYEFTHPGHLGAIARLFGVDAAPAVSARICEIGCASGTNLLWMASHLPDAEFVGLDFSAVQIKAARAAAQARGLSNVVFEQADLLDFDPGPLEFDYIIAHGFLSWVPDPVKQALLEFCRAHLAERGVAFISYNCYPGWHLSEGLRMLAQLEQDSLATPQADPGAGLEKVLRFFESARPAYAESSHGALLDTEVRALRAKPLGFVIHDEIELVNDPCYFLQFADWARECGLGYLADADFLTNWPDAWPDALRKALSEAGCDRLRIQQYLDFAANRKFRQSLLCRAELPIRDQPDPLAVESLWVRSKLRADNLKHNAAKLPVAYYADAPGSAARKPVLSVDDALLQSVLADLSQTLGQFRPLDELFGQAFAKAGTDSGGRDAALQRLGIFILTCQAQGWMELATMDRPPLPK
jgi:SAM-dependent methyltransferase